MGPYCKFCNQRCFVHLGNGQTGALKGTSEVVQRLVYEAYGHITIIATCRAGQALEQEKRGWSYDKIRALASPEPGTPLTAERVTALKFGVAGFPPFEANGTFAEGWNRACDTIAEMVQQPSEELKEVMRELLEGAEDLTAEYNGRGESMPVAVPLGLERLRSLLGMTV